MSKNETSAFKKRIQWIFIICTFSLLISLFVFTDKRVENLGENGIVTKGIVTGFSRGYRAKRDIKYRFLTKKKQN